MKLKDIVEIIALLFVFIVGSILLIGLISDENFKLIYFIFLIILMIIILFAKRSIFENRSEILYILVIGILICLSLTYFFSNIKLYYQINPSNQDQIQQQTQIEELKTLSKQNSQYYNYLEYQNQLIKQVDANILELETQIENSNTQFIETNNNTITQLEQTVQSKDEIITKLNEQINKQNDIIINLQDKVENIEPEYIYVYERGDDDD